MNEGQKAGFKLVSDCLLSPLYTLCRNAGIDYHGIKGFFPMQIIDFTTGKAIPVETAKIIDPAKVVREAIENSISVATMILSTECIIENPE